MVADIANVESVIFLMGSMGCADQRFGLDVRGDQVGGVVDADDMDWLS